jgi:hypothetical protein
VVKVAVRNLPFFAVCLTARRTHIKRTVSSHSLKRPSGLFGGQIRRTSQRSSRAHEAPDGLRSGSNTLDDP